MARSRFFGLTALVLALAFTADQAARTEERPSDSNPKPSTALPPHAVSSDSREATCVIYSLNELGADQEFGEWIAQTIPEVLEPGTWKGAPGNNPVWAASATSPEPGTWKGTGVLRYNAAKNILIVYQTPAMHAKVDEFLKELKKSLPRKKDGAVSARHTATQRAAVVPVEYRVPAPPAPSGSSPEVSPGYPVPVPVKAPKHLFHFIIRYEGEGIIDDNVVKFMKLQSAGDKTAPAVAAYSSTPSYTTALPAAPAPLSPAVVPPVPQETPAPKVANKDK